MPIPKPGQIEEWFKRFEKQTGHKLGLSARVLANRLKGSSYSEIEDFGNDVLRRIVLSHPGADVTSITQQRLRHWAKRFGPNQVAEDGKE